MAHNAKLTFPIIWDIPTIVKQFFYVKKRPVLYFSAEKKNGFSMRSFCQNVIARRQSARA